MKTSKLEKSSKVSDYEMVLGLEVHVELGTKSKIFCGCATAIGAPPNTQCCPVCMGLPGSLPVLNEKVVAFAARAGLALHAKITPLGRQDRKNYFYPDLPKAYQVSQSELPIALGGHMMIEGGKKIGITRLHIEEDAGKLIHEGDEGTCIDYNRCGVPLIEIVSEPDFRSADEVKSYLQKLRATLMFIEVSECKMNEGAFRCDVNLSVRKKGETKLGTRTEMKNLNSFAFIVKAIAHEFDRQVAVIESGEAIVQETRRWDASKGMSFAMRSKEDAHDYRYFPDPDLMPIAISATWSDALKKALPLLPDDYIQKFIQKYGIKPALAEQLVTSKSIAMYYEACAQLTTAYESLAGIMVTEVIRLMGSEETLLIATEDLSDLVDLIDGGKINLSIAKRVLNEMWDTGKKALTIIENEDLWPVVDLDVLTEIGESILKKMPQIKADYLNGKHQALGAFMGQMMRATGGKADPVLSEKVFLVVITDKDH